MLMKLRLMWAILRGRPVMYRMDVSSGSSFFINSKDSYVCECHFTVRENTGLTGTWVEALRLR
jgi:hypothetical protein